MQFEEITSLVLDGTTNYVYLADPKTYELYYMNPALLQSLGISESKDWLKQPCYKILYGADYPCEFCSNFDKEIGTLHIEKQFNPKLQKELIIKEKLIHDNSVNFRLVIAIDTTQRETVTKELKRKLHMEETLIQCIQTLNQNSNMQQAIENLLSLIGSYHMADRAYIMEIDTIQNMCVTYEWCRNGIPSKQKHTNNIPLSITSYWQEQFEKQGRHSIKFLEGDICPSSPDYSLFAKDGIHSLLAVPLWGENQVEGVVGVDNPTENIDDMTLLQSASSFIVNDINKRKLMEQLTTLSYMDGLTKVGNRYKYLKTIEQLKVNTPNQLGVIFIDVIGLKSANDTHGHEYGDYLLLHTAEILKGIFEDLIFRIGGDEFVVFVPEVSQDLFNDTISCLRKRVDADGDLKISIGYCWRDGEIDIHAQIAHTDELMYVDKQTYYDAHQEIIYSHRTGASNQLLHEIKNGMFSIYLQPKIEAILGTVIGAEAMIRRKDEFDSFVPADIYLFRYEKEYIIRHLDFFALETVGKLLRQWESYLLPNFRISLRFSKITFLEHDIEQTLSKLCKQIGILPSRIAFIISENFQDMDKKELFQLIQKLSDTGFYLLIDDFILKYKEYTDYFQIEKDSTISIVHTIKIYRELDSKVASLDNTFLLFGCEVGGKYYLEAPLSMNEFIRRFILK